MTLLETVTNNQFSLSQFPGEFRYTSFEGETGPQEVWLTLCPTKVGSVAEQLAWLEQGFNEALQKLALQPQHAVFKRFLCSDLINQAPLLKNSPFADPDTAECAISLVQQPPLAPAKVALTAYFIADELQSAKTGKHHSVQRDQQTHTWTTGLVAPQVESSFEQTECIFQEYQNHLDQTEQTLLNEVVRTWLYVKDVDSNYLGLVEARNGIFAREGLTPETHYIASTGIEGAHIDPRTKVLLDSYSIKGLKPTQVKYLNALDHLGYTHDYGVAFERATQISYADRKHIFVSGTASIDNKGHIVHVGDVERQLQRTLQNISALLADANATLADLKQCIVYIRDPADAALIHSLVNKTLSHVPCVLVTAPVCRPGWLIEIEGIACLRNDSEELPTF